MSINQSATPVSGFVFSDIWYTRLKWISIVLLPALATLYFTLGAVWGLPAVEQVIGTITAFGTFLGVMIGISARSYNHSDARYAGIIDVNYDDDGKKVFTLELNGEPEGIELFPEVTFKVSPANESLAE